MHGLIRCCGVLGHSRLRLRRELGDGRVQLRLCEPLLEEFWGRGELTTCANGGLFLAIFYAFECQKRVKFDTWECVLTGPAQSLLRLTWLGG